MHWTSLYRNRRRPAFAARADRSNQDLAPGACRTDQHRRFEHRQTPPCRTRFSLNRRTEDPTEHDAFGDLLADELNPVSQVKGPSQQDELGYTETADPECPECLLDQKTLLI